MLGTIAIAADHVKRDPADLSVKIRGGHWRATDAQARIAPLLGP